MIAVNRIRSVVAAMAAFSAIVPAAAGAGASNAPSAPAPSPLDHYYPQASPGGDPSPPPRPLRLTRKTHEVIPYSADAAIPEGYRIERTWQSYLVKPSAYAFAASYLISLSVAAAADFEAPDRFLAIPVVGPGLALFDPKPGAIVCKGIFDASVRCISRSDELLRTTALVFDGLTQLVSASLLVMSLPAPTFELRRDMVGKLQVVPLGLRAGYGLGVRGVY